MKAQCIIALIVITVYGKSPAAEPNLAGQQWSVDGLSREALVYVPADGGKGAPVVFAFHGHGGSSRRAAELFHVEDQWPQAVVVYMQGLPMAVRRLDPQGEGAGWQGRPGQLGDRDLHFFDAVLKTLRERNHVDDHKVFCTGNSQGGVFTYLLWAQRGDQLAAVAAGGALTSPANLAKFKPKAVLHVAGMKDDIIPFDKQKALIEQLIKVNACDGNGQKLGEHLTRYPPADGKSPVFTLIHGGGHELPDEAAKAIVAFFKRRASVPAADPPRNEQK